MTRLTVRLTEEAMRLVEGKRYATGATKTRIVSDAVLAAFGVKRRTKA